MVVDMVVIVEDVIKLLDSVSESLRRGTRMRTSTPRRAALVKAIRAGSPGTKYGVVSHARWLAEWIAATCMRWIASSGVSSLAVESRRLSDSLPACCASAARSWPRRR